MQREVPLGVWFYSSFLVFIFFALFFFIPQDKIYSTYDTKLNQLTLIEENQTSIVAIGTSLTAHSFYFNEEMNSLAKKYHIENLNFLRFAHGGRDFRYFDKLFEKLIKINTDIIFLDASLLFYKNQEINAIREFRKEIIIKIKNMLHTFRIFSYESLVDKNLHQSTEINLLEWQKNVVKFKKRYKSLPDFVIRFLTDAKKNGKRIYIFKFTRAKEAQELFPKEFLTYEKEMVSYYQKKYNVNYIEYPSKLSKDYYIDFVHSNMKGRVEISKFFLLKVKVVLEKNTQ